MSRAPSGHTLGHALALFTILLWGMTFISTKILLVDFSAVEILISRFILGYIALFAVCPKLLRLQGDRRERIKQELYFVGAGLSGVSLYFLLENIALEYTYAANVSVIVSVAPFFTAILAHFFLKKENFTRWFFYGFLVAISGIILISFNGKFVLQLSPLGDVLSILAGFVWAIYSILLVKIGKYGYSNLLCTRRIFGWALVTMIPTLFFCDIHWEWERYLRPLNLLNMVFLGIGASALCFALWNYVIHQLGAVKTSVYIYLIPVVTIIFADILLNEKLTLVALIGTALAVLGLFISKKGTY